jgi:hypothetical protein
VDPKQYIGAILFAVAILHTFSTRFFLQLAHRKTAHAGLWHLLGEVEVVFGLWALVLALALMVLDGPAAAVSYLDSRDFTEPLFVFAIMVVAASRPILQTAAAFVKNVVRLLPLPGSIGLFLGVLIVVPLLGSLITEPAAMTVAALVLARHFFSRDISTRLKYAILGVLFVNISIGGALTPFAAPPILMVAAKWGWDLCFMWANFGWGAAIAVIVNALGAALIFRRELAALPVRSEGDAPPVPPLSFIVLHLALLAGIVVFAHHPVIFMGLFLLFLGIAQAYRQYHDRLVLREGLLVAYFLAGLVVLGGQQEWWLQPLLVGMSRDAVFYGAMVLTAFADNAALTYLGSLVEGLSHGFQYALVAGAVTGGGLTIIANAPNPAGIAILGRHFEDQAVRPLNLLLAALPPTVIAALAFRLF